MTCETTYEESTFGLFALLRTVARIVPAYSYMRDAAATAPLYNNLQHMIKHIRP